MKPLRNLGLLLLLLSACQSNPPAQKEDLSEWSDEIIYFALIDRFADGNPNNNDQGFAEYDTTKEHSYHGGDFAGLQAQLPYLQKLGVTSLWLTPPVRNNVWSRDSSVTGYHGYWASHFMETDPHLGSLEEYRKLARGLHDRQMKLIQDVVTNHTGDYFGYQGTYNPNQPAQNFVLRGKPLQKPFDQNDARKASHRKAAIYHFTPSIADYNHPDQKLRWQMSDLDDLNTENPVVIAALKKSFRFWMDSVGIDGIRFDTPLYVDHPFWHHFLHDSSATDAGLKNHALKTDKTHFFTFGETWVHSNPYNASGEVKARAYLGSTEKPEMDGILNFPMQQSIHRVFAGGAPSSELAHRLAVEDSLFPEAWQRLHFIDNHDMPRFRSSASEAATRQALAFIMTIPGIPVLYYGTEQGVMATRPNLFNRLDTSSNDFQFTSQLIALRKSSKVFSRGKVYVLADENHQPGLFSYEIRYEGETKWVFFNHSESTIHTGMLPVSAKQGQMNALMQQGEAHFGQVQSGKLTYLRMLPKSWVVTELTPAAGNPSVGVGQVRLSNDLPDTVRSPFLSLEGSYSGFDSLQLFINGIDKLQSRVVAANGRFKSTISLKNVPLGKQRLVWIGWLSGQAYWAGSESFYSALAESILIQKPDPVGDDRGPNGTYRYPAAFEGLRSIDFTQASLQARGNELLLDLHFFQDFSKAWNPPLGFDHLQIMVLLNVNNTKGAATLKEANYRLPGEATFTHYLTINGWQMQAFSVKADGRIEPMAAAPQLELLSEKSLRLVIAPALLGYPEKLEALEIHILGWDSAGEGGLRQLSAGGGAYEFGGGNAGDPKWMDRIIFKVSPSK